MFLLAYLHLKFKCNCTTIPILFHTASTNVEKFISWGGTLLLLVDRSPAIVLSAAALQPFPPYNHHEIFGSPLISVGVIHGNTWKVLKCGDGEDQLDRSCEK